MKQITIILMLLFLVPFIHGEIISSNTDRNCIPGGMCEYSFSSGTRYQRDLTGEFTNIENLMDISKNGDDLTFTYDSFDGNYSVTLEAGVIHNGVYRSMQEVKTLYPQITFSFPNQKTAGAQKYSVLISNIPAGVQPNIESVTLTYKSHSGFDLSKFKSENGMKFNDFLHFSFLDAENSGFNYSLDLAQKRVFLGNITPNIVNNSLYIDPLFQDFRPHTDDVNLFSVAGPLVQGNLQTGHEAGGNDMRSMVKYNNLSVYGITDIVEACNLSVYVDAIFGGAFHSFIGYNVTANWSESSTAHLSYGMAVGAQIANFTSNSWTVTNWHNISLDTGLCQQWLTGTNNTGIQFRNPPCEGAAGDCEPRIVADGGPTSPILRMWFESPIILVNVTLLPENPVTEDDLFGYATATETSGSSVYYHYSWFKNGVFQYNGTTDNFTQGVEVNIANYSRLNTTGDDNITLGVFASSVLFGNTTEVTNSTTRNVLNFGIDNCTIFEELALNISFQELDTGNPINVDYETTISFESDPTQGGNYSNQISAVNFTQLCIFPNGTNYTANILIKYTNGTTTYEYNLVNATLDRVEESLILYVIGGTDQVILQVNDIFGNPISAAYVSVLKYDVGTGAYTTTEIVRTDGDGQTIANIILIDDFYRFIISIDGIVRLIEPSLGGVRVLSTTKTFVVGLDETDWFEQVDVVTGASTSLIFNNVSDSFVYTWSDPRGEMHQGCLKVVKINRTGEFLISDSCTTSASSSIVTAIAGAQNGSSFVATGYFLFDEIYVTDTLSKIFEDLFGFSALDKPLDTLYYGFFFILGITLIGIPAPIVAFTLLIVGLIFTMLIGLYKIGIGIIIGIAILVAIQMYKQRQ